MNVGKAESHPQVQPATLAGRDLSLRKAWAGRRVLVVGDVIADEYVIGRPERISREAPVLILREESRQIIPGGAGNTAQNLAALGAEPLLVSVVGDDPAGASLQEALQAAGISTSGLIEEKERLTFVKTRVLAGDRQAVRQQVVRLDRGTAAPATSWLQDQVRERVQALLPTAEAMVFSDYGLGLLEPSLVAECIAQGSRLGIPIVADSRYRLLAYKGVTVATPNQVEAGEALGVSLDDDAAVVSAGWELIRRLASPALLITRGAQGMDLFVQPNWHWRIPAMDPADVFDVTGAGDTVTATLALALAAGSQWPWAALLANVAAGLVVRKMGTRTVSSAEVETALAEWKEGASWWPLEAKSERNRRPS
ncbi:MAG: carbohydrate kinase [Limnochordaceae bacterium]|nr:carbohydrate kinase [Limnochordaceae bacterium]